MSTATATLVPATLVPATLVPFIFATCYDVVRHIGNFLDIKSSAALYLALHNNPYTKYTKTEENGAMLASRDTLRFQVQAVPIKKNHELQMRELLGFLAIVSEKDRAYWNSAFGISYMYFSAPTAFIAPLLANYAILPRLPGKIREIKYYIENFQELRNNKPARVFLEMAWQEAVAKAPQTHLFDFYITLFNVNPAPRNVNKSCPWNNTPDCVRNPLGTLLQTCEKVKSQFTTLIVRALWQIYTHAFKWVKAYQNESYLFGLQQQGAQGALDEQEIRAKAEELKEVVEGLLCLLHRRLDNNAENLFTELFDTNPNPRNLNNFKRVYELRRIMMYCC